VSSSSPTPWAQVVVDRLEAVEIEEEHGELRLAALRGMEHRAELLHERIAVRELGQRVVGREEALALLRLGQVLEDLVALDRVDDGARDQLRRDLAAGQTVLCAGPRGLQDRRLVALVGQHDDRDAARRGARAHQGVEARPLVDREIEEHRVEGRLLEQSERVLDAQHAGDRITDAVGSGEDLHQPIGGRVVLDDEQERDGLALRAVDRRFLGHASPRWATPEWGYPSLRPIGPSPRKRDP
jgi:hypothetical protein